MRVLQEETDTGPYLLANRLHGGGWFVDDISRVIRLGLIGGGMPPAQALQLVRNYVEAFPPLSNLGLAQIIIGAGIAGVAEEEVGKKAEAASQNPERENEETILSPTERSDLPPSMGTA